MTQNPAYASQTAGRRPDLPDDSGAASAGRVIGSEPYCPWCSGAMRSWLTVPRDWRRPECVDRYALFWCGQCEYGCLHPRPSAGELPSFYAVDSYYTHRPRKETPGDGRMTLLDRARCHLAWRFDRGRPICGALIHELLEGRPSRICDLGCGAGGLLEQAKALGHTVTGVEPDAAAGANARGRGVTVYEGTAENLPRELEPASFDLVLMSHALEHCLDPVNALRNARSLLAPSGTLLCETPNSGALGLAYAGVTWFWLDAPRHLNFFTERSLGIACGHVGLSVVETHGTGYYRQFTPGWIEAERRIWQVFNDCGWPRNTLPVQSSAWRSWKLLCRSALASRAGKYDSIRVVAHTEVLT